MTHTAWDTFLEEHDLKESIRALPSPVRISLEQFVKNLVLVAEVAYETGLPSTEEDPPEKVKRPRSEGIRHCRDERLWAFLRQRVDRWLRQHNEAILKELNQGETYRSYNGNRRGAYLPKGPRRR